MFQVCCTLDSNTFFQEGNIEIVLFRRFHGWEVLGEHFPACLSPCLFASFLLRLCFTGDFLFFSFLIFVTPVVVVILLDVLDALKHTNEVYALVSLNSLCLCFGGAQ